MPSALEQLLKAFKEALQKLTTNIGHSNMKLPFSKVFVLNFNKNQSQTSILTRLLTTLENILGKNDHIPKLEDSQKDTRHHYSSSRKTGRNDLKFKDALFEMFKNKDTGLLSAGKFFSALTATGIRKSDPRLKEMMVLLEKVQTEEDTQKLSLETFRSIISPSSGLIKRAFQQEFVIPEFQKFCKEIEGIYWTCKNNTKGNVATYIPQLSRVNPNYWGMSVCTIDGQRFSMGDEHVPFTLQSCSKPLTYSIALDLLGEQMVHKYVGQEPSGRMFNELILDFDKKPHNPMVNAGAILICALIKTLALPNITHPEKFDYILKYLGRLAGGVDIGFNNTVFMSEKVAADRNYALGFYLKEHKCFPEGTNFQDCMDLYFQCCSMETTCDTVSLMAATLANGGICPLTDEKVLKPESVRNVLSLMHSCGMYDYSGQFAFKVGMPSKSGVSGGLLVVVPNVMGLCLWSPPLDPLGNSCRGVQFCETFIKKFNFHRYDNLRHTSDKINPRKRKHETVAMNVISLIYSAAFGDLSGLQRHRLSGMDMSLADYDGRTALHLAAAEGHDQCVRFLLQQCNVPYDVKDRWGRLPVDEAGTFGHTAVVDILKKWDEHMKKK